MKFYSKSTYGFYSEDIHGHRKTEVLDPTWVSSQIEIPNPDIKGETMMVDDPENPPRFDCIDNPDCLIPLDAVEVSDEQHADLFTAQSDGKMIVADQNGNPIAVDRPAPSDDELATSARTNRDRLLTQCDWVVTRAFETATQVPAAWLAYRQGLRDVTEQSGFPSTINWPTVPQ